MKVKDLLKAIEAHNLIAEMNGTKRAFVFCEYSIHCKGYIFKYWLHNAKTEECDFYSWNEFAASIADELKEVISLIAKGQLKATNDKDIFLLENADYCDGISLKIFVGRE